MAEPSEGAWIMLKRLVRHLVDHGRLVQVISKQRYVKSTTRGHRQRLRGMRAYQEEHDVRSSVPWRQFDQSRELDARHAKLEY